VLGLKRSDRVVFSRATFSCWNFVGAPQETILWTLRYLYESYALPFAMGVSMAKSG